MADGALAVEASSAPLEGVRVIDVSTYVAGPSAGMTLAQMGADVVRVDPPGGATDTARLPRAPSGLSLYWAGLNKGKRSVELDLSSDVGVAALRSMLGRPGEPGGILLTNAPSRAPLSLEALRELRADAIVVRITGHPDGRPAVDYTVNCQVGLPWLTGAPDALGPVNHVLPAWDLLTGLHAALAVVAAERVRQRTGEGQEVTVSLSDVAVASMANLGYVADVVVNGTARTRDGNHVFGTFGCDFTTADGDRVMVVALTQRHWDALVGLTGVADVVTAVAAASGADLGDEAVRYQYRHVFEALMTPWFASHSSADVAESLDRARVLWGPYRSVEDLVADPTSLLHEGDLMVDVEQPGAGTYPVPRGVLTFGGWDMPAPRPAPRLGEHTAELLEGWGRR